MIKFTLIIISCLTIHSLALDALGMDLSGFALPRQAKMIMQDLWNSNINKKPSEKKPDEGVCYSRWEAEGIYALRVSPPTRGEDKNDMQTENLFLYGFNKVYDANEERFRLSAYPISSPILTPDSEDDEKYAYRGPIEMIVKKDEVWLIRETKREWEEDQSEHRDRASCRKFRMKFQKMEPIKRADYLGLSFEHNTLCNHYMNVHEKKQKGHGKWTCNIDHSELFVDAFDHSPVEVHMEGKLTKRGSKSSEYRRIIIHVFFKDFEFLTEREDKKLLQIPENVEELCEKHGEYAEMTQEEELLISMFHQMI